MDDRYALLLQMKREEERAELAAIAASLEIQPDLLNTENLDNTSLTESPEKQPEDITTPKSKPAKGKLA